MKSNRSIYGSSVKLIKGHLADKGGEGSVHPDLQVLWARVQGRTDPGVRVAVGRTEYPAGPGAAILPASGEQRGQPGVRGVRLPDQKWSLPSSHGPREDQGRPERIQRVEPGGTVSGASDERRVAEPIGAVHLPSARATHPEYPARHLHPHQH